MNGIRIVGIGSCAPQKRMTNADFEKIIDTTDEWIASHTGIRERRYCEGESHTHLCVEAAKTALCDAGVSKEEIGVCLVATLTGEYFTPSAACMVQATLGLPADTVCLDINAACTGFIAGLHTAECLLARAARPYALVIGADVLSRFLDFEDRGSCILFGDGAGAAVAEFDPQAPSICAQLGSKGDNDILTIDGVGLDEPNHFLKMKGTAVFKFAVENVPKCMDEVLERSGYGIDDFDVIAFHQANERIIDTIIKRKKLPPEKCFKNISRYGNTSSASIPLLLDELRSGGFLLRGMRILALGFGGGLTWGGAVLEYAYRKDGGK